MQVENSVPNAAPASEGAAEASEATPVVEAREAKQEAPRKYAIKVNGKVEEVTEEKLIRWAQQGRQLAPHAMELAQGVERLQQIESRYKDPQQAFEAFLELHGEQGLQLLQQRYVQAQQREAALAEMTPRERALFERNEQVEREAEQLRQFKEQREQQELTQREQAAVEQLRNEVGTVALNVFKRLDLHPSERSDAMLALLPMIQSAYLNGAEIDEELIAEELEEKLTAQRAKMQAWMPPAKLKATNPEYYKQVLEHAMQEARAPTSRSRPVETPRKEERPKGYFADPKKGWTPVGGR